MSTNLAAIGYLVAAVCFILALRGLSSPATCRPGNRYGMVGMTIAIVVTLLALPQASPLTYAPDPGRPGDRRLRSATPIAQRIEMTAMPQLVAAFHSLVGLAAVFVAVGAFLSPARLRHHRPRRRTSTICRASRWGWASSSAPSPSRAR